MTSFIFITDLHITDRVPFRTGDPLEDVIAKIDFTVDYANKADAQLLIGGDIYDSPVVSYRASTRAALAFSRAKYRPIVVKGNHDQMYRNDDYDEKTALYAGIRLGVFQELTEPLDFGSCILTPCKTPPDTDKPVILMYHGFLNIRDGKLTVTSDELREFRTPTVALLGHDHIEYDPITIGNATVYRIGSLFRNRRVATSDRAPKLLHVLPVNGGFSAHLVSVPAKSVTEIFKETEARTEVSEAVDYSSIISELKTAMNDEADLHSIIAKTATPAVGDYLLTLLSEAKLKRTH